MPSTIGQRHRSVRIGSRTVIMAELAEALGRCVIVIELSGHF